MTRARDTIAAMRIVNPATEEVITELPSDSPSSVEEKARRARTAATAFARRPLEERLGAITRFKEALAASKDELATTLSREMGKPVSQARNEITAMDGRLAFFLAETRKVLGDEKVLDEEGAPGKASMTEIIKHEPLGLVANVSAWNYPYFVGSNVFVPALLTGNTVLYKPSEYASMTGQRIAELLWQSGIDRQAFVTAIGGGDVGAAVVAAPVDAVFFTGSYPTGVKIAQAAASRLVKVQLELGGKDPTYVAEDVDPKAAAEGLADGAFYNTGQSCCSVERIYVNKAIAQPFIEAFVNTVRGFKVGDPLDPHTYIGPLARDAQREVLEAQVADAVSGGAKLLVGGKRISGRGYYFEPTVLTDVSSQMKVMRDESFGPIIGIQVVSDDAEAVRLMNDSEYGLTAGVYCRDKGRAEAILSQVDAGSVYWNCCDRVSPRLPWSGRRHSGIGETLSTYGIRTFLRPKAWHLRGA